MLEQLIQTHIERVVSTMIVDLKTEVKKASITNNSYLNRSEAAKYLSVCTATIDNQVRWGNLTKYKLGSSSRFKICDLDSLLTNTKSA
ncbi:helix-turn-helix domain-containing protein [Saprospiraceae bacterium]|nr:helix-turn-helix domain-containing protein [Saprospiraceae bacterium]